MHIFRLVLAFLALFVWAGVAHAHPGHDVSGLVTGFFHPLGGPDHLLAMIAIGVWAAQLVKRAIYLVPLCFVTLMSLAAAASAAGMRIPLAEVGIMFSVITVCALILGKVKLSLTLAAVMAGSFGFLHGYVHGIEMPENITGLTYGCGFVLATMLLQILGIALGSWKEMRIPVRMRSGRAAMNRALDRLA